MSDDSSGRIVTALRAWVADAPPGARLPSTRALVTEYAASPVTVQKAIRSLAAQGMVETRPGVGTFVRTVRVARAHDFGWQTAALGAPRLRGPGLSTALRTTRNDVIALHSGYPDRELLPERLVRAAFGRAARSDAAAKFKSEAKWAFATSVWSARKPVSRAGRTTTEPERLEGPAPSLAPSAYGPAGGIVRLLVE